MQGWRRLFGGGRSDERQATPADARDEQLSAYLDDALTPPERAEVEAALAGDDDLRDRLEGLRAVRAALRSLDEVRAPRSFALTAPPARARTVGIPRLEMATRVATIAAAALFVVALVLPGGGSTGTVAPGTPGATTLGAAAAPAAAPAEVPAAVPTAGSQAATPAGRALAVPAPSTPSGRAAPVARVTPGEAPAAGTAESRAPALAPAALAPPPGVATRESPDRGARRLITVGLGALTVLLAAVAAGEWIVRSGT